MDSEMRMALTSPPQAIATKGRQKMNSTKRDKSYWELVSITHRKIQKSSSSFSGSGFGSAPRGRGRGCSSGQSSLSSIIDPSPCSTFPYIDAFPSFLYPFIENRKNLNGDGNCGYRVVADFLFGDEDQWHKVCRRMIFELEHMTNMYLSLFGSAERMDAHCPLYTCNGNIIIVIELAAGQRLILIRLQTGTRGMLEHINQEIPFMLTCCLCN
ncbi:hypothetical protein M9H77_35271 [Catharanthus roseus]|uniref:Uncharacterized protein n=1 Tax=Catharanthus roseus TaxID=4058 RepID=A0ACB9ZNI7_CATRO|nr:hypothetical protein M9H77_35271 [Catharanthus roseus]